MRNVYTLSKITVIVILFISIAAAETKAQTLWGMSSAGGSKNGGGNIFSVNTDGTFFKEQYAFLADGGSEQGQRLLNYGDGYLYGVIGATQIHSGILYRMLPDGTNYQLLYNFQTVSPTSGLIKGADGFLYGTTELGGSNNNGGLYKISTSGTGYQVLHNFVSTDGSAPSNELVNVGTVLYGTTATGGSNGNGVFFKINTDGTGFTVMHYFSGGDGRGPNGALAVVTSRAGSTFYGTASSGGGAGKGVIYKVSTSGLAFQLLYSFSGSDGASPTGGMAQAVPGALFYGTTRLGGINNTGIVFAFTTAQNSLQILHNFPVNNGVNEALPNGVLLYINDYLYGSTELGGTAHDGVLFKIGTDASGYQVIHQQTDANGYFGSLSYINNQLYGLTQGGTLPVDLSLGTIYRVNTDGSSFQQVHSFNSTNGYTPSGSLIRASDGNLYGLTTYGGSGYSDGEIFSIKTNGLFTALQQADNGPAAGQPQGSMIQAIDGSFYGLNLHSNSVNFDGSVFRLTVTPALTFQQFFPFCSNYGCGAWPLASLLQATDGNLYGTTSLSGSIGTQGTVFKINTNGTGYIILHTFGGADGGFLSGSLIQAPDGFLYGMTQDGGTNNYGTIFKIKTDGTLFQTIFQFASGAGALNGLQPQGSLLRGKDGKLYGMTSRGGTAAGVVFRVNTDGTGYQVINNFTGTSGAFPAGSLIQDAATSTLYGMTYRGGVNDMGTIFKLNPDGTGFVKLLDFNGVNGKFPKGDLLLLPAGAPLKLANPVVIGESKMGIDNMASVEIAPNPVHNAFNIHFKDLPEGKLYYSLSDMNGKMIRQQTMESGGTAFSQPVDMAGLPAGIYVLKAVINGRVFIKKIVKQ